MFTTTSATATIAKPATATAAVTATRAATATINDTTITNLYDNSNENNRHITNNNNNSNSGHSSSGDEDSNCDNYNSANNQINKINITMTTIPSTTNKTHAHHVNEDDDNVVSVFSDDNDDDDDDFTELSVEDENHVCDISLMRIVESSSSETCDQYDDIEADADGDNASAAIAGAQVQRGELEMVEEQEDGESEVYEESEAGDDDMYLNELTIDRRDEEQTITELVRTSAESNVIEAGQNKSMRVAFGIILRLVLPLANGVVRGIQGIRDARFLRALRSIASSRQALTNLMAFAANTISMNLSSVHVSHRIEPILKILKIRKSHDGLESLPDNLSGAAPSTTTPTTPTTPIMYSPFIREPKGCDLDGEVPKCCTLNVLAEPPPGVPIRADIVFIHGLHGSLVNTWKQGLWENDRHPVKFERPPKPPVRPPKRPRHSRTHLMHSHHKLKRARFAHRRCHERESHEELTDLHDSVHNEESESDYSFVCGEPKDIEICDGVEYSFPTFRLRMNDGGRLLQAELESMLQESSEPMKGKTNAQHGNTKANGKGRTKKSAKDVDDKPENYSKCWPGDWLPLDCPGVRVLACNYTTDQYLWRPLWKKKEKRTNLIQRSREMAELLIQARVGYGHPIVWVGHSKGGLFVKQIIVDAWESGRPAMAPFWRSARGAFFYSVPHRGSHLASIKAPLLTRSVELIDIEKNSKYLLDLHRRFASLYHLGHLKIEVFSFVETALTLMSVLYLRIVGVDSADPGIGDVCGIRLDHREICKPRSRECILYKELVKMINKVC